MTMKGNRSARRLAALLVCGLLGLSALAGCRSDPAVAAYVGDTEITQERVDEVVDALRATFTEQIEANIERLEGTAQEDTIADFRRQSTEDLNAELLRTRDQVVIFLILIEAVNQYAAAEDLTVPEPALDEAARALAPLPEDHPYVQVVADYLAVSRAMEAAATPVEPSETDQREAYRNLRVSGEPVDVPFEQVQPVLNVESLGLAVSVRDLLVSVVERADVRVQPGYDLVYQVPVQVPPASSFLAVRIGEPSSVVDAD
jgi:hypothetical protein